MSERSDGFERLCGIMHRLRAPGGCPWDREQTHSSLVKYLIEESYEVSEAIDAGDDAELVKELGDVLLQVVFHAEIASEEGRFKIEDILESISSKMIRRHPHVFGDASADDSQAVLRQWEAIKQGERGSESSLLEGIPNSLPALLKALRLQGRASQVGFDWDHIGQVKAKVHEEFGELEAALEKGDEEAVEEELGDLLFALVNWARYMDTDPEKALQDCNRKFVERFRYIETTLLATGKSLAEADITEMDALWEEAKIVLGGRKKP